jgi:hypothetical protein
MSRMARAIARAILLFQALGKPRTRKIGSGTFRWVASRWSDRTDQRLDLVAAGASGDLVCTRRAIPSSPCVTS